MSQLATSDVTSLFINAPICVGRNFIFSENAIFDQDTTTEGVPEPASVISCYLIGDGPKPLTNSGVI